MDGHQAKRFLVYLASFVAFLAFLNLAEGFLHEVMFLHLQLLLGVGVILGFKKFLLDPVMDSRWTATFDKWLNAVLLTALTLGLLTVTIIYLLTEMHLGSR